jgi:hypothetical protein
MQAAGDERACAKRQRCGCEPRQSERQQGEKDQSDR